MRKPVLLAQLFGLLGCGHHHAGHSQHGYDKSFAGAETWATRWDAPERDTWQRPDEVMAALGLASDMVVADIGAGTGYFTARLARRLTSGAVYAVDVEPDMVRYLGERAQREGLANVTPVLARHDDPRLPAPVDLVLVVDTYHHLSERTAYFGALRGSLKPGGRVAIIDFKLDSPEGPPPEHRLPADTVVAEMTAAGYTLGQRDEALLPRQYLLVFAAAP